MRGEHSSGVDRMASGPQRRCRIPAFLMIITGIALSSAAAWPVMVLPKLLRWRVPPTQLNEAAAGGAGTTLSILDAALREVQPLREQVEGGALVPKFGQKAAAIVRSLEVSPEVGRAVDSALQGLFLRQLTLLRRQVASKFEKQKSTAETLTRADQQFVEEAELLKRPGSAWSYDPERYALRAFLEGAFRRDSSLVQERKQASQTRTATVEVISRLQNQIEVLQQRVEAMRAKGPWLFSLSYRLPKTPLQFIGRYQQGYGTILELNLAPDRDPANAEAGFVEGLTKANIGVGLALHI